MKVFLVSALLVVSSFTLEKRLCNQLKFDVSITHTSNDQNNGIIEVVDLKSTTKVKAFLYGDKKSKNRLDVKVEKLTNLESGKYLLVLQNNECSSVKKDIIIK